MKLFWYEISKAISQPIEKGFPTVSYNNPFSKLFQDLSVDKDLLYEIYRKNPDIRSCIRKKALYTGSAWIELVGKDDEALPKQENKKIYDEVFTTLSNPTFMDTKVEMIKHLDVSGELYILPTTDPAWKINGFQLLHPKTMIKEFDKWKLVGFRQNVWGSSVKYFATPEQWDIKLLVRYHMLEKHTDNERNGMGLLEGLIYDVLSDLKSQERNYYFFENDSTPSWMITLEPGMTEKEQQMLVDQLNAKHKGAKNNWKPLLAPGVKDWKMTTLSPKDMEHILQRKMTTEKVCSALWVPKSILNYTDSVNYSTSLNERREFIEGTINNYQKLIQYIINDFFEVYMKKTDNKIRFTDHQVEDDIEISKIQLQEVKTWVLTINEYRELKGRDAIDEENADKSLITKDILLLEDVTLDPLMPMSDT